MDVQFIASVAVITPDPSVSRRLYVDALGLPLTGSQDDYLHSEDIDGSKSFGVWPLTQAALLHEARAEPWGQTVARLQSSEGAIIGLSYVPSMHS